MHGPTSPPKHRRRRPPPERTARSLAQPAGWVDWVITPEEEKPASPNARSPSPAMKPTSKAHPDQPLQRSVPPGSTWPTKALDGRRRRLRLDRLHSADMPDDEILRRLLALNLERAAV